MVGGWWLAGRSALEKQTHLHQSTGNLARCFVCTTQTSLEPNLSLSDKQIRIYRVDVEHYFCAGSALVHNWEKTGAIFLKEPDLKQSSRNIKTRTFGLKCEILIVVDTTLFTLHTPTEAMKLLRPVL